MPCDACKKKTKCRRLTNCGYDCNFICYPPYIPTPPPAPIPIVSYITNTPTINSIFSGGATIPAGTIIPAGSTTVPANTVTVITGYTGIPTTNIGGVILDNGFFTIPVSGVYDIATIVGFALVDSSLPTDLRAVTIYRVDGATGLVTILATGNQLPIVNSSTFINLATNAQLNATDRVFVAARQINGGAVNINTVANVGRFALTLINPII